jgi:hypothetical protein
MFDGPVITLPHVRNGNIKAYAVTANTQFLEWLAFDAGNDTGNQPARRQPGYGGAGSS